MSRGSSSSMATAPPFPLEHGVETCYRLCAVPLATAVAQATITLARALPGGRLALIDSVGCLRVLQVKTQRVTAVYQVYRGSFLEAEEGEGAEEEARVRPPEPCALPWSDLAFVPGREGSLFLLLGETNSVMYTTLPPALDTDELLSSTRHASASFAYGSALLALSTGKQTRIRTLGVDATGSVLASGDDDGCLRVWALSGRSRYTSSGGEESSALAALKPGVVDVAAAHEGPILCLTHGETLAREEGHVVTGGKDKAVRVWSWQMDEWGALRVRPLHTLLTEACNIRCLAAGAGLGLVLAGSNRGTLYCWSSLTSILEYVAMGGTRPLTAVAALAEEEWEEEDDENVVGRGEEASVIATADAAGIVRLYRPVAWEDEGEGNEAEEEEDERNTWQPVAESPLDGPAIGAFFMKGSDGGQLVVVSSSGMVMPWPVATLPCYPGDDNRAPPPPRPASARREERRGYGAEAGEEEEEEEGADEGEEYPRQGPPPSPLVVDAAALTAQFSSLRAWEHDTEALAAGWQPCELGAPTLNSTAVLRDALEKAQQAQFPTDEIDLETSSVLEDAARAVDVDPRFRVYKGVVRRDTYRLPPPQLVAKTVDPVWRAKQERRPTALDFFTPGLEEQAGSSGTTGGGRLSLGREEGGRGGRVDPYLALYKDT